MRHLVRISYGTRRWLAARVMSGGLASWLRGNTSRAVPASEEDESTTATGTDAETEEDKDQVTVLSDRLDEPIPKNEADKAALMRDIALRASSIEQRLPESGRTDLAVYVAAMWRMARPEDASRALETCAKAQGAAFDELAADVITRIRDARGSELPVAMVERTVGEQLAGELRSRLGLVESEVEAGRKSLESVAELWMGARTRGLEGDRDGFMDCARRAAEARGLDEELSEPLLRALFGLLSGVRVESGVGREDVPGTGDGTVSPRPDDTQCVLCAGFGWSGSGAVLDHLVGFSSVHVFSHAELIAFAGDATTFLKRLLGREGESSSAPHAELFDYLSIAVLGLVPTGELVPKAGNIAQRSLLRAMRKGPVSEADLIGRTVGLIESFGKLRAENDPSGQTVAALLRDYFDGLVFHGREPGDRILLNNVMRPFNAPLLDELVSDLRTIAVSRDPRDQYVEMAASKKGGMTVDDFIRIYNGQMKKFDAAIRNNPEYSPIVVRFEDFVLEEKARSRLERQILPADALQQKRKFRPESSRRNIGIHRQFPVQEDIRRIEKELERYLHPRCVPPGHDDERVMEER